MGAVSAGDMLGTCRLSVLLQLQELLHGAASPAEIPAPRLSPPFPGSLWSAGLCPHTCSRQPGR